jgi:predicted RNase H-like nuclease (RuvC/YqgF family)
MILKYNEQGQPYEDLNAENKKLKNRVEELDNSLSIALNNIDRYQRENKDLGEKCKEAGRVMIELNAKWESTLQENKKLKKRAEEAEGENTIIKGIGQNSPEMKAAHAEIDRLSEENDNLKTMKGDGKNTSNNS